MRLSDRLDGLAFGAFNAIVVTFVKYIIDLQMGSTLQSTYDTAIRKHIGISGILVYILNHAGISGRSVIDLSKDVSQTLTFVLRDSTSVRIICGHITRIKCHWRYSVVYYFKIQINDIDSYKYIILQSSGLSLMFVVTVL